MLTGRETRLRHTHTKWSSASGFLKLHSVVESKKRKTTTQATQNVHELEITRKAHKKAMGKLAMSSVSVHPDLSIDFDWIS
jgi:hypothetical protein